MTGRLRLSLTASTPDAQFSALVYREPFASSFAKVAALGFDGLELAIRDPRNVDVDEIVRLAHRHHLPVCALGTGQAFGQEGLSFTDSDTGVRRRAVTRVMDHIELAGRLKAKALVIIGLIRGRRSPEMLVAEAEELMLEAFGVCAEKAERLGVDLVIEPINRYETNLLNTVDEALGILGRLGSSRVGLLLDTFHMNIEEPSITASIRRAGKAIRHVHIADSNRWAPGFGHLGFAEIIGTLGAVGYDGFLSAEILPYPDPDTAARTVAETIFPHRAG